MQKKLSLIATAVVFMVLFMASCSKNEEAGVEAIPFQEVKDGQWGMISPDGKVIFKEEFKNQPTVVREGRFFVKNKDGLWEMYDAAEKPKKIGGEYAHATSFQNGRALVAEKGKPVSIIDVNGKTIKLLDKIEGKTVDEVSAFNQGYAVISTTDSLCGIIDADGNCTFKPKDYCWIFNAGEGKFVAVNKKYKKHLQKEERDKVKFEVIDSQGKVIFSFNGAKYDNANGTFTDGKMPVSVKKDGKQSWGIIDDKGQYVLKPMSKVENIGSIHGDKFTYYNGEGWGLMDLKGQTVIRAKYEQLFYDDDNLLIAVVKDGDEYKFKYIDEKDNQIGKDTYVLATAFTALDGKHALVKPDDKMYSIIDRSGKQVEGLPDMINVSLNDGDGYVESDYVDLKKIIADLGITQNGSLNFTFSSTPQQVVKEQVKQGMAYTGDASHPAGTPYWYDYTSSINFWKNIEGASVKLNVSFSGILSRQTYRTQRVIDYEFYDEYWYHDEKIPTGYVWNAVHPDVFTIEISNNGRMHGKLRDMLKALTEKFKTFGKIVKQNDGAAVLSLNNGKTALICMSKDHVTATWGALGNANAMNIDKYADVSEDSGSNSSDNSGLNSLLGNYAVADSTAVDSAVVDSMATDYY